MDGEGAEAEGCLHGDEQVPQWGTELRRWVLVAVQWIWQCAGRAAACQCMFVCLSSFK